MKNTPIRPILRKGILKIVGLMMFLLALSAQGSIEVTCGEAYLSHFNYPTTGFGSFTRDMYSQKIWDFYDEKDAGPYSRAMTIVGAPLIVALDAGFTISDSIGRNVGKRRFARVGSAILDPNSKLGKKGLQKLYGLVRSEVQISNEEFNDFFHNKLDKSELCKLDDGIALTEKGLSLVGDGGLYLFLATANDTPIWNDFWDDPRNFTIRSTLVPLAKQERRSKLTELLLIEGFQRKVPRRLRN